MLRGLVHTGHPSRLRLSPVPHLDASQTESIHNLALLIKSKGYKLIIVDNLGLITGDVEENSAEAWRLSWGVCAGLWRNVTAL